MKMKKLMTGIVMAGFLTFAIAGQAMAYFEELQLMRVVYDDAKTLEVATDLVDITTLSPGDSIVFGGGADAFTLSMFPAATTWADLQVTYFTKKVYYDAEAWITTIHSDHDPELRQRGWTNFESGATQVMTNFGNLADQQGGPTILSDPAYQNSYNSKLNQGVDGTYAEFIREISGEASLANLENGGYVDMYLYYYTGENEFVPNPVDNYMAVIRTYDDGSTRITMSPVPIPGAVILLGSGLLALVGIRSRKSA